MHQIARVRLVNVNVEVKGRKGVKQWSIILAYVNRCRGLFQLELPDLRALVQIENPDMRAALAMKICPAAFYRIVHNMHQSVQFITGAMNGNRLNDGPGNPGFAIDVGAYAPGLLEGCFPARRSKCMQHSTMGGKEPAIAGTVAGFEYWIGIRIEEIEVLLAFYFFAVVIEIDRQYGPITADGGRLARSSSQ